MGNQNFFTPLSRTMETFDDFDWRFDWARQNGRPFTFKAKKLIDEAVLGLNKRFGRKNFAPSDVERSILSWIDDLNDDCAYTFNAPVFVKCLAAMCYDGEYAAVKYLLRYIKDYMGIRYIVSYFRLKAVLQNRIRKDVRVLSSLQEWID